MRGTDDDMGDIIRMVESVPSESWDDVLPSGPPLFYQGGSTVT